MQKQPLVDVHCQYEPYCDYPVAVRLTMEDGHVQTYILQNRTEYQFNKVLETLDRMTVGYPRKRRNRRR